jgi:hypothetical protein
MFKGRHRFASAILKQAARQQGAKSFPQGVEIKDMGRFGDVWKSGKYSLNPKQGDVVDVEKDLSKEVVSMMQDVAPEFGLSEASHVVLSTLRPRRGLETGRWLNNLATETQQTAQPRPAAVVRQRASAYDEMVKYMDLLFQQLNDLSFEFNKTAVDSNLLVTLERPEPREKPARPGVFGQVERIYAGRLTTSQWALGVLGTGEKISIYLIPAAMLLAFIAGQISDRDYPPFMDITGTESGGETVWMIGGQATRIDAIPHLAKELLGDLIRVASGVMSDSELFASGPDKLKLGENLAVGYPEAKKQESKAQAESGGKSGTGELSVADACDLVDGAVDRELKRLYDQASKLKPESDQAAPTRTRISDLEKFRSQMLAAFTEYTHGNPSGKQG